MNLQLSWPSGGNAICQGKMTSKTTQNAVEETRKAVAYFSPLSQKKWKKKNYKRGKIASLNCGINATCDDFLPLQTSHKFMK